MARDDDSLRQEVRRAWNLVKKRGPRRKPPRPREFAELAEAIADGDFRLRPRVNTDEVERAAKHLEQVESFGELDYGLSLAQRHEAGLQARVLRRLCAERARAARAAGADAARRERHRKLGQENSELRGKALRLRDDRRMSERSIAEHLKISRGRVRRLLAAEKPK